MPLQRSRFTLWEEETKQIHKQAGRKKRRQFIPNQKGSVEKEVDRFIHQTYKIHFPDQKSVGK